MPRKKPSEEMSVVPESIRDWWGGRKPSSDMAKGEPVSDETSPNMRSESTQMARARRELQDADMESRPSLNPMRNAMDLISGRAMDQAARLSRANEGFSRTQAETGGYEDQQASSYQKMAKGGLVKKGKGGMIQVRGQGKARSKPCKCC